MHSINKNIVLFLLGTILCISCSKEEIASTDSTENAQFLKFEVAGNGSEGTVLYSNWVKSGFPNSSLAGALFFSLPLMEKGIFDQEKDLAIVYGKRNNSVFSLPATIPLDNETYSVIFTPVTMGTDIRLWVASSNWQTEPLQDIFFRPNMGSQFRVVVIPGEKLFELGTGKAPDFRKMDYHELLTHFGIPE